MFLSFSVNPSLPMPCVFKKSKVRSIWPSLQTSGGLSLASAYLLGENRFSIPEVWIYSIKGQLIKKLKISAQDNNKNLVYVWDGCDKNGRMVSSGLYVAHAKSEDIDIYRTIICNK